MLDFWQTISSPSSITQADKIHRHIHRNTKLHMTKLRVGIAAISRQAKWRSSSRLWGKPGTRDSNTVQAIHVLEPQSEQARWAGEAGVGQPGLAAIRPSHYDTQELDQSIRTCAKEQKRETTFLSCCSSSKFQNKKPVIWRNNAPLTPRQHLPPPSA